MHSSAIFAITIPLLNRKVLLYLNIMISCFESLGGYHQTSKKMNTYTFYNQLYKLMDIQKSYNITNKLRTLFSRCISPNYYTGVIGNCNFLYGVVCATSTTIIIIHKKGNSIFFCTRLVSTCGNQNLKLLFKKVYI